MSTTNQSTFIKSLNKSDRVLLSELKELLNTTIIFLDGLYVTETLQLKDRLNLSISEGQNYIFKINAYLQMLMVKDDNQSHKYLFEECVGTNIHLGRSLGAQCDLRHKMNSNELDWMMELAKIKKNCPEMVDTYKERIDISREEYLYEFMVVFNSYINDYYLAMMKIKEILNKCH